MNHKTDKFPYPNNTFQCGLLKKSQTLRNKYINEIGVYYIASWVNASSVCIKKDDEKSDDESGTD